MRQWLSVFRDRRRRSLWLRSLRAPWVSARWSVAVSRQHRELGAPPPPVEVLAKPLRKYVYSRRGPHGRLKLLLGHQTLFSQRFSRALQFVLCSGERSLMATLHGRKGSLFRLELAPSAVTRNQREGELVLCFGRDEAGASYLSRLTFLLAEEQGNLQFVIGGLQGSRAAGKREVIDATRLLHCLRPKDATFLAARALADALHANLRAVADAEHVLQRKRSHLQFSEYGPYWRERGGVSDETGDFVFPALPAFGEAETERERMKQTIVSSVRAFVAANLRNSDALSALRYAGTAAPAPADRAGRRRRRARRRPGFDLPRRVSLPTNRPLAHAGDAQRRRAAIGCGQAAETLNQAAPLVVVDDGRLGVLFAHRSGRRDPVLWLSRRHSIWSVQFSRGRTDEEKPGLLKRHIGPSRQGSRDSAHREGLRVRRGSILPQPSGLEPVYEVRGARISPRPLTSLSGLIVL